MSDESVIAYSNVLPWRDVRIRIYEFTIINSYIRIHTMAYDRREDWEGDNGNSVATEDDDNEDVDAEAGEYACNFLEVALRQL